MKASSKVNTPEAEQGKITRTSTEKHHGIRDHPQKKQ
jgi:hypothetical protein